MTPRTQQIDGEFWFTAKYAATLLKTSRKKVEAMAVRELLRSRPDGDSFLIAEPDVTRLRRDSKALADVKEKARMPADPRRGETMPEGTVYRGDKPPATSKVVGRVGHPLLDQGSS